MKRKRDSPDAAATTSARVDDGDSPSGAEFEEALTEVARIKGWATKDKGQGEIINTIVDEVTLAVITVARRAVKKPFPNGDMYIESFSGNFGGRTEADAQIDWGQTKS
ncbi:hypothetical protein NL676_026746 [Syzygium grande]|nr:hypothetical protein NL676_026746 [Syzygium grande]